MRYTTLSSSNNCSIPTSSQPKSLKGRKRRRTSLTITIISSTTPILPRGAVGVGTLFSILLIMMTMTMMSMNVKRASAFAVLRCKRSTAAAVWRHYDSTAVMVTKRLQTTQRIMMVASSASTSTDGSSSSSSSSTEHDALPYNQTAGVRNGPEKKVVIVGDDEEESTDAEPTTTTTTSENKYWNPNKDFNMTYPKALSPSAINEFLTCPQSFLFQYIYGIRQPTSLALAKGSLCHTALEQVYDLEADNRTVDHLQNLFRKAWSKQRRQDTYRTLFVNEETGEWDLEAEAEWGREALQLLQNYVDYEDPRRVTRPNPVQREVWVQAHLALDPRQGSTGYVLASLDDTDENEVEVDKINGSIGSCRKDKEDTKKKDTFWVRGIVDRLDMVRDVETSQIVMRLTDYKTGKVPELKYSEAMNNQIVAQNFFQLQIYALLLREKQTDLQQTMDLRFLRLLYLTSQAGPAVAWDYDMGATAVERDRVLQNVHAKLSQVWMEIVQLVSQQDPTLWHGCDRSFCYCHKCRPRFQPGTVWEPPPADF